MLIWKRVEARQIVRCQCGRTTFFRVGLGRMAWVRALCHSSGVYHSPDQRADEYQCKACGSYEVIAGPAESTPAPSAVAA